MDKNETETAAKSKQHEIEQDKDEVLSRHTNTVQTSLANSDEANKTEQHAKRSSTREEYDVGADYGNNSDETEAEVDAVAPASADDDVYDRMYINPIFQTQSTTARDDDDFDDDIENIRVRNEDSLNEGILQSITTRPGSVERVRYILDEDSVVQAGAIVPTNYTGGDVNQNSRRLVLRESRERSNNRSVPGSVVRVTYVSSITVGVPINVDEDSVVQVGAFVPSSQNVDNQPENDLEAADASSRNDDSDPEPVRPIGTEHVAIVDAEMMIIVPWYRQIRTWLIILFVLTLSAGSLIAIILTQTGDGKKNESPGLDGNINSNNDPTPTPSIAPITSSPTTFMDRQYATLKQLYSETGGSATWKNADGWSEPSSASYTSCDWFGVSCNYKSEVTDITLSNNGLVGDISLVGTILLQIPTLEYIDLRSNRLTGDMRVFSESMAQLSAMKYLDVRFNDIEGSVSNELCVGLSQANVLVDCSVECSCCAHEDLCECSNTSDWVSIEFGLGCDGFEEPQFRCDLLDTSGMSGTEACCSCGGGNRVNPIPSISPSYLPTTSPSLHPTSMPSISVEPSLSMRPSIKKEDPISTREILIAFYNALNGDNWTINTNWLSPSIPECDWFGLYCNDDVITSIDFYEPNNMVGSITSTIGMLSTLKFIRLNENPITSSIPSEIANLKSLTDLSLRSNSLTSSIPTELFLLAPRFKFLDLSENADLTGTFPTELGLFHTLQSLQLSYTGLKGTLPTELGMLESLQNMYIIYSSVSGTIPTELWKLSSLAILDLHGNFDVTGTLPKELVGLSESLTQLNLLGNSLTGPIPTEFSALSSLTVLSLEYNYISGAIPTELGLLSSLSFIGLLGNILTGTIPTEIGLLENCYWLDVMLNSLTGTIPTELGMLSSLSLFATASNSNVYGSIPSELGNTSLEILVISGESISGTIPSELGMLSEEASMILLYNNQLSGTIPTELTLFLNLEEVRLDKNNLTGTIPTELGAGMLIMKTLNLSSNSLSGNVPSDLGRLTQLNRLLVHDNDLTGVMPQEVCIRFGFGLEDLIADCVVELECECCTECCADGAGCVSNI